MNRTAPGSSWTPGEKAAPAAADPLTAEAVGIFNGTKDEDRESHHSVVMRGRAAIARCFGRAGTNTRKSCDEGRRQSWTRETLW